MESRNRTEKQLQHSLTNTYTSTANIKNLCQLQTGGCFVGTASGAGLFALNKLSIMTGALLGAGSGCFVGLFCCLLGTCTKIDPVPPKPQKFTPPKPIIKLPNPRFDFQIEMISHQAKRQEAVHAEQNSTNEEQKDIITPQQIKLSF